MVSFGDSLHEMSKLFFLEKQEKYYQFVVCWICSESDKGYKY